jgi:hypothetical protein
MLFNILSLFSWTTWFFITLCIIFLFWLVYGGKQEYEFIGVQPLTGVKLLSQTNELFPQTTYEQPPVQKSMSNKGEDIVAVLSILPVINKTQVVSLCDKGFNNFRVLPPLGWLNSTFDPIGVVFTKRQPIRGRTHGLARNNVKVFSFSEGGSLSTSRDIGFETIREDEKAVASLKGEYPSLEEIQFLVYRFCSFAGQIENAINQLKKPIVAGNTQRNWPHRDVSLVLVGTSCPKNLLSNR